MLLSMKLFTYTIIIFNLVFFGLNAKEEKVGFGCKKFPIEGILTLPGHRTKSFSYTYSWIWDIR